MKYNTTLIIDISEEKLIKFIKENFSSKIPNKETLKANIWSYFDNLYYHTEPDDLFIRVSNNGVLVYLEDWIEKVYEFNYLQQKIKKLKTKNNFNFNELMKEQIMLYKHYYGLKNYIK